MKKETALRLIQLWQDDSRMMCLTEDEMKDTGTYIVGAMWARAFIASTNKAASDALWDKKLSVAFKALMKYGIGKQDNRYQTEANGGRTMLKTATRNRKLDRLHRESAQTSNWKVCK